MFQLSTANIYCIVHNKSDVTVEPRFNELPRNRGNAFVISRVRKIENLDKPNLHENNKMFVIRK